MQRLSAHCKLSVWQPLPANVYNRQKVRRREIQQVKVMSEVSQSIAGKTSTAVRWLLALIVVLAVGLRISLACVPQIANDDHVEVVRKIIVEQRLPGYQECWECFQPKLYHLMVAEIAQFTGMFERQSIRQLAQLINLCCSLGFLLIAYKFIWQTSFGQREKLTCYALLALNPALLALGAQPSHDIFLICLASLFTLLVSRLYKFINTATLYWALGLLLLCCLIKGNALVLMIASLSILLGQAVAASRTEYDAGRYLRIWGWLFILAISIIPLAGQYIELHPQRGIDNTVNLADAPFPNFFEETYPKGAGVTSIFHSLFTFRLLDLLDKPTICAVEVGEYPRHRTSIPTMLYAQFNTAGYLCWPPGWRLKNYTGQNIYRLNYLFALLPAVLLPLGFLRGGLLVWRRLWARDRQFFLYNQTCFHLLVGLGYLAFIVLYSLIKRDFTNTKVIYIFPGILSFSFIWLMGLQYFFECMGMKTIAARIVNTLLILLVAAYLTEGGLLVAQAWSRPPL